MILLVKPNESFKTAIFEYKREMVENGDIDLSGCGGLDKHDHYENWINSILQYSHRDKLPEGSPYVEGSQWMLVNTKTNRILGFVNIRHYLNDFLTQFGGHIGYSIRPSERRKGYAKLQLSLALEYLKTIGVSKALITCDVDNIGSSKTIEACGGILENIVNSVEHGKIKRYWIDI